MLHGNKRRSLRDLEFEDLDQAARAYATDRAGAPPAERTMLRDDLVRQCLPLASRLARRYRDSGEPLEDLEQVARLGLMKAVDRYDPARGSFTACVLSTITGELKKHFRDRTWGVHVPRRLQDLSLEARRTTSLLTTEMSRNPTSAEVAERLGLDETAVNQALESAAGYSPASLNAPMSGTDGQGELADLIGAPDRDLESLVDKITLSGLLLRLPDRERRMLALRFCGDRTQAQIAAELGISQMHVSRLLNRALAWLREAMLSDTPPRWEGAGGRTGFPDIEIAATCEDGVVTVRMRGEIDRDTAGRLRVALRHAIATAEARRVVVDLTRVCLLDAAGVRVLVEAASAAAVEEIPLSLTGVQPYVAGVLRASGLGTLLRHRPPEPAR